MPPVALRTVLFVPAGDQRKLARALRSPTDLVIVDLEDAVPEDAKGAARAAAVSALAAAPDGPPRAVRVNAAGTPHHAADLEAVRDLPLDLLVLPKAEPGAVLALGPDGPPLLAIVETARGLRAAHEIASAPRVAVLMLGAADLGAELGLVPRADGAELLHARSRLVVDSAAAGVLPPVDGVALDLRDAEALAREASLARSLGMGGKACVHPAQLDVVRRAFAPTADELSWAERVVAGAERAGGAAFALDGRMVDVPVLERARRVLGDRLPVGAQGG
jgi:citrate lyase beta subunit